MKAQLKRLLLAVIFIIGWGKPTPIVSKTPVKDLNETATTSLGCNAGTPRATLAERIDNIISQSFQRNVRFSIHIIKADSGETVYSHNATETMVPASNMKIVTTAAALKYLGPDYQFKTKVGLADNTLVIIGSGDPLLGDEKTDAKYGLEKDWIFKDVIALLKEKGVPEINDIIVDTTIFDDQRVHPSWPESELNRWYACEVSGLNYNNNCIAITAKNIGGKVSLSIEPTTSYVTLINKVTPVSKGTSSVGSYRTSQPNRIVIHGRCRLQAGPFDVAIERPAVFFGYLLAEHLMRAGINTTGQIVEKTFNDDNFDLLAEYSTSIADCLARSNKNSLGLAAEALLKTIAAHHNPTGNNGSWAGGQKLIRQYLRELGIHESQFYIDDGSGLSRQNELSALVITKVLSDVYHSENWPLFRDSLAVGGVDGTIARYFREKNYKGRIRGKTGYIRGVRAFSGICSTTDGNYIFSILANNANAHTRQAINDIVKAIVDRSDM